MTQEVFIFHIYEKSTEHCVLLPFEEEYISILVYRCVKYFSSSTWISMGISEWRNWKAEKQGQEGTLHLYWGLFVPVEFWNMTILSIQKCFLNNMNMTGMFIVKCSKYPKYPISRTICKLWSNHTVSYMSTVKIS